MSHALPFRIGFAGAHNSRIKKVKRDPSASEYLIVLCDRRDIYLNYTLKLAQRVASSQPQHWAKL